MFLLGALDGAFGISECMEVTLALSVITKGLFNIAFVSICP